MDVPRTTGHRLHLPVRAMVMDILPDQNQDQPLQARPGPIALSAGDGTEDPERLVSPAHLVGKRGIEGFVRQVTLGDEEAHHGTARLGLMIADRAAQHRVRGFKGIDNRSLRHLAVDIDLDFLAHPGQGLQVWGQNDANHDRVCTSTDITAGRS